MNAYRCIVCRDFKNHNLIEDIPVCSNHKICKDCLENLNAKLLINENRKNINQCKDCRNYYFPNRKSLLSLIKLWKKKYCSYCEAGDVQTSYCEAHSPCKNCIFDSFKKNLTLVASCLYCSSMRDSCCRDCMRLIEDYELKIVNPSCKHGHFYCIECFRHGSNIVKECCRVFYQYRDPSECVICRSPSLDTQICKDHFICRQCTRKSALELEIYSDCLKCKNCKQTLPLVYSLFNKSDPDPSGPRVSSNNPRKSPPYKPARSSGLLEEFEAFLKINNLDSEEAQIKCINLMFGDDTAIDHYNTLYIPQESSLEYKNLKNSDLSPKEEILKSSFFEYLTDSNIEKLSTPPINYTVPGDFIKSTDPGSDFGVTPYRENFSPLSRTFNHSSSQHVCEYHNETCELMECGHKMCIDCIRNSFYVRFEDFVEKLCTGDLQHLNSDSYTLGCYKNGCYNQVCVPFDYLRPYVEPILIGYGIDTRILNHLSFYFEGITTEFINCPICSRIYAYIGVNQCFWCLYHPN
jgi:hypothetical protein